MRIMLLPECCCLLARAYVPQEMWPWQHSYLLVWIEFAHYAIFEAYVLIPAPAHKHHTMSASRKEQVALGVPHVEVW